MYCGGMTSPSTSTTSGTVTTCTPSSKVDRFREEEASGRIGKSVFFTAVNQRKAGEDLEETQNRSVQTHVEISPKYCILVQFQARSEKRSAALSKSIKCNILFKTPRAICLEKVVKI